MALLQNALLVVVGRTHKTALSIHATAWSYHHHNFWFLYTLVWGLPETSYVNFGRGKQAIWLYYITAKSTPLLVSSDREDLISGNLCGKEN